MEGEVDTCLLYILQNARNGRSGVDRYRHLKKRKLLFSCLLATTIQFLDKFNSSYGWPGIYAMMSPEAVRQVVDTSFGIYELQLHYYSQLHKPNIGFADYIRRFMFQTISLLHFDHVKDEDTPFTPGDIRPYHGLLVI